MSNENPTPIRLVKARTGFWTIAAPKNTRAVSVTYGAIRKTDEGYQVIAFGGPYGTPARTLSEAREIAEKVYAITTSTNEVI